MNAEWCNKAVVIKYLFKYVTKGSEMMLPQTPPSVMKPPGPRCVHQLRVLLLLCTWLLQLSD
jgi:hypothetical protein